MRQKIAKEQILDFWEEKKETWNKGDHNAFYESAQNFFHWLALQRHFTQRAISSTFLFRCD